jgi:hypothetical protein
MLVQTNSGDCTLYYQSHVMRLDDYMSRPKIQKPGGAGDFAERYHQLPVF